MWLAVEATPPEVPYETIGLVIVTLITAVAGIVVAVVQRGKKQEASSVATSGEAITRSDPEWTKIRDTTILSRATIVMMEREVRGISENLDDHIEKAQYRQGKAESEAGHMRTDLNDLKEEFRRYRDSHP